MIDQITKAIFADRDFFFGFLKISGTKNFGLPFGINTDARVSLIIATVIVTVLFFHFVKTRDRLSDNQTLGYGLILSGATSNLIDRIFLGHVRDVFDIHLGFVFNVADLVIFIGLLVIIFAKSTPDHKQA